MTYDVGTTWTSTPRPVGQEHLTSFSPPPRVRDGQTTDLSKSAHADPEAGQRLGLRSAFAWGLMSHGYVQDLLLEVFGARALQGGAEVEVTFAAPVFLGDTIVTHARVTGVEPREGGPRLTLDVWCENQADATVTTGVASIQV